MKKAQINQVFVYILSVIIILFVGFLVTKFITAFLSDADSIAEAKFFSTLENDYKDVFETYGSEEVLPYKVSGDVAEICFVSSLSCVDSVDLPDNKKDSLNGTILGGDNVVIFDKDDILSSKDIGKFTAANNGCFCIKPLNSRFELVIENDRNEVLISQN